MITLFDVLMVLSLLALAWQTITAPRPRIAVVTFLPYAVLMSLAWARLEAPDIAIAEAAIGGGMTAALLFAGTYRLRLGERVAPKVSRVRMGSAATIATLVGTGLCAALWSLPRSSEGLGPTVRAHLDESGAGNPVTAVLLNFRAYDTLLEIAVLLIAMIAVVRMRQPDGMGSAAGSGNPPPTPMLRGLVRVFVPPTVLMAGYLLWRGGDEPGGAFQAGALLAGAGVLLSLEGRPRTGWMTERMIRLLSAAGVGVFGLVALAVIPGGRQLLEYPRGWEKALILLIEAACTLSIAIILTALFHGAASRPRGPGAGDGSAARGAP